MSTRPHTSGPWALGIETDDVSAQVINSQGAHVCTVAIDPLPDHAHLIAAAPELFAALEGMLEWARRAKLKEPNPGLEVFNACNAIAKAEGGGQ